MSSQVRRRIKKYPTQFVKVGTKWYMSKDIANYFIKYRDVGKEVNNLPSIGVQTELEFK